MTNVDDPSVVVVTGELDILTSAALTRRFGRAFANRPRRLVVDLTQVTFFDSTGLRTIEDARLEAAANGCELVLACVEPRLLRLFEITGLLALYEIFPSVAAALTEAAPGD